MRIARSSSAFLVFTMLAMATVSGCGIVERLTGIAARKEAKQQQIKAQTEALQQKTMRYGDQFVEGVTYRTSELASSSDEAAQIDMHRWQYAQATAVVQIAGGPNPVTNALDMVVLASLSRRIVEEHWTGLYGAAAGSVVREYRRLEGEAWRLLEGVLSDSQRAELEAVLSRWFEENPDVQSAAFIRFADFAGAGPQAEVRVSPGLLGIIGLDPLAGIDPAVREFEQTRILAERALYYAQRLPVLLDLQLKLTIARLNASPESEQILATIREVGELSDSVEHLTGQMPELIAREREAAIAQLMGGLEAQNAQIRALAMQLKETLEAGTLTAQSLDGLVRSTDALVARFAPTPKTAAGEPSRPFDINDYTRTVTELATTARELQTLVRDVDALTPGVEDRLVRLTGDVRGLVQYTFVRLLALIAAVLVAALIYRALSPRLVRRGG
ncbi:MAG TPA: hypothetical protein VLT59_02020 [Steroidobacteraceae bacterium]|nr:hypothetical protein [Steroidobacteraceae bacterium]